MTCTEEYKEHIVYTFHAFCRVVIRNAMYTAVRTRNRKYKREISLDYLTDEKHYPFGTKDEYFKAPEPEEEYLLTICGDTVVFSNAPLAEALSRLSEQCCRSTAGYHIRRAIGRLYEEMEGMAHEE